jgi:hypothetical protein
MKNLIQINTNVGCIRCGKEGFFCVTPNGADDLTCPCCDSSVEQWPLEDYDFAFCKKCRILFENGCVHAVNGCTSDTYNAHFIRKWTHNNETYVGMPQFDNIEEMPRIKILEYVCIHNGMNCAKAVYPKETHPKYYSGCTIKTFL